VLGDVAALSGLGAAERGLADVLADGYVTRELFEGGGVVRALFCTHPDT
jgi:hypothetical protein